MVTFLITSLVILAFLAAAAYFWQKPAFPAKTEPLPLPPGRGLFIDGTPDGAALAAAEAESLAIANADQRRSELLSLAAKGEKSVLEEARNLGNAEHSEFYDEVLNTLVESADSAPKLLALGSYVTRHEFPVNKKLAARFIESCKSAPDKLSTAKMLHLAALSNEADVYEAAAETALECWRKQLLRDLSPQELLAILEGEFWLLSSHARSSGAGFLLKRTLSNARRELEAAHGG